MENSNNFASYASKFLSSRILGQSSGSSPIFHANYDESSSNHGPWMNDDEIEQEMAHLKQSTASKSQATQSPPRSPSAHSNQSESTPDINQAQSLFTNQSALSYHKPDVPDALDAPEPQEEIELQLSQPLLTQSHKNDTRDDVVDDEDDEDADQPPQQIFIQQPTPLPPLTSTPIRKYRDAPFVVAYGFSIISVLIIGVSVLFTSNTVGHILCICVILTAIGECDTTTKCNTLHHNYIATFYAFARRPDVFIAAPGCLTHPHTQACDNPDTVYCDSCHIVWLAG